MYAIQQLPPIAPSPFAEAFVEFGFEFFLGDVGNDRCHVRWESKNRFVLPSHQLRIIQQERVVGFLHGTLEKGEESKELKFTKFSKSIRT